MPWYKALQIIVASFLAVGILLAAVLSFSTVLFWNLKASGSKLRSMPKQHELQEERFGFLPFWSFGSIVVSFFLFRILFEQLGVV